MKIASELIPPSEEDATAILHTINPDIPPPLTGELAQVITAAYLADFLVESAKEGSSR